MRTAFLSSVLFATPLIFLTHAVSAATNIAADATATASSIYNASYPPQNAIDGIISDPSRWLSANTSDDKWLLLTMPEVREAGGYVLYSGWESADAIANFYVEQWQNEQWELIPSSQVRGNDSQEVLVRFDQSVSTDALRFIFEDNGIVRVREILVWAPGDEPEIEEPNEGPVDPDTPIVLVNQSGYNTGAPKRFTALGFDDGATFTVETVSGTSVFKGSLNAGIGDFSDYEAQTEEEFVVKVGEVTSDPFRIGPYWLERVTYQNAMDFMIAARNFVGNTGSAASLSYSWRDDHHFAFVLRSLVDQFLSNPAAYERMPQQITYSTPQNGKWGALTPYDASAPDIVKMIHWGADTIVSQELKHEFFKSDLAFFLYAWPWLEPWLDEQNYQVVRDYAVDHWTDTSVTQSYPYDATPSSGHNLFQVKTKVGDTKGNYPPGFSVLPNTLMWAVLDRENDPDASLYRDAARAQVAWLVENLDLEDPQTTKGQRMSENLLMSGLAAFARLDPEGKPANFDAFVGRWAEIAIRRSENFWDFRKLTDTGAWTPYVEGSTTKWNEPGNVAGFPAAALAVADLLETGEQTTRLEQLAWAAIDNMFGRNPAGRHFSYDAPREIEGVERGWYSFLAGGVGQLRDVPFVLDGSPKDPHYPFHPEKGDIGWTEGWVSFNSAYNRALAGMAYRSTKVSLKMQGESVQVLLTAPLNFDYTANEPVSLILTTSSGDREVVTLQEISPFATTYEAHITANSAAEVAMGNGILEVAAGDTIRTAYGLGYYEHADELEVEPFSQLDSDGDHLPDSWELRYYDDTSAIAGETNTNEDGTPALYEFASGLDPRVSNTKDINVSMQSDDSGDWIVVEFRENTYFSPGEAFNLYRSNDLENWQPVSVDGIDARLHVASPDMDGDGEARLLQISCRIAESARQSFLRLAPKLSL